MMDRIFGPRIREAFVVAPIRGAEARVSDPDLWSPVHLRLGRN